MKAEDRKGLIDSISNWLKLLALSVLVAEAVIITAMSMTPDTSTFKDMYPVFMLLFLLVPIVGLFFDRHMEREATSPQKVLPLLNPADRQEALGLLIGVYAKVLDQVPKTQQAKLRETRQELETELVSLAPEPQQARKQLKEFARAYDSVREGMMPGSERTLKLTSIVTQARALAEKAGYGSMEVSDLFAGGLEGDRIVSLAIVQVMPTSDFFDLVLQSISGSRSAFEQYQALQAMERMLPLLNSNQKQTLAGVLKDQRSGGPGKYITPDSDRWLVSSRMLDAIK